MSGIQRLRRGVGLGLVAVAVGWGAPALAHHSFAAEFDENQPIKLTGKVTEMKWSNPHAWIYIDVVGGDGKVTNWGFETGGVNALYRRGWRKADLAAGTQIIIDGWRARNGTSTANAFSITFPDGHRLFAGTSAPKTAADEK
jgi:hypothetical protein